MSTWLAALAAAMVIVSVAAAADHPTLGTNAAPEIGDDHFAQLVLRSGSVRSIASGDLIEKDWGGRRSEQAHRDAELIVGAGAESEDQLAVWFNHFDDAPIFGPRRSYGRHAPSSVLCIATAPLVQRSVPFAARRDLVTGTALSSAGNFFTWYTWDTAGNEGYLAGTPSRAYRTVDGGDVQAVGARDVVGGPGIDLVVGTRSPESGHGSIEIWRSDDSAAPTFERSAVVTADSSTGAPLGEIVGLRFIERAPDRRADLIVGTRRGATAGEIVMLDGSGGFDHPRSAWRFDFETASVTGIEVLDYDLDGAPDLAVALRTGPGAGEVQLWRGSVSVTGFVHDTTVSMPGEPCALASADLIGAANPDLAIGFRSGATGYRGGVRVICMDGGSPGHSVDPSNGSVTDMVQAIVCDQLDAGWSPTGCRPSRRADLVTAFTSGPRTGGLVVFFR